MHRTEVIKNALIAEGAAIVGVARAVNLPVVEDMISESAASGLFVEMDWLGLSAHKRTHPMEEFPGAKSIICSAWTYSQKKINKHFARYALHIDYHGFIQNKLRKVWDKLGFGDNHVKYYVDSGPLAEKAYASLAGIGWIGKNSLIINENVGSFFCIGFILTDMEFVPDKPSKDMCGECSKCIDACPTKAIVAPGMIDCRRCISYLTTEHKGELPANLRTSIDGQVFGCDICQEVCPFNKRTEIKNVIPEKNVGKIDLQMLMSLSDDQFKNLFNGTPVERVGKKRLIRNVSVAMDNLKNVE